MYYNKRKNVSLPVVMYETHIEYMVWLHGVYVHIVVP